MIEFIWLGIKKTVGGVDYYYIPSNYTGWYVAGEEMSEQQQLSYFSEDVGLNAFYVAMNHDFPIWMNSAQYNMPQHIRGELYIYTHKQLLNRYYLERLSNDLGEISYVDVNKPVVPSYYPMMHHPNGLPFLQRPVDSEVPLYMHKYVQVGKVISSSKRIVKYTKLNTVYKIKYQERNFVEIFPIGIDKIFIKLGRYYIFPMYL